MPEQPRVIPRRAVASWVLYDLANTVFSMGVVSLYFSLYVRDQVGAERADSTYGIITTISMGMIFIISPLLGAMSDRARRRMPFLIWSTIVCVICTALLARGSYLISAVLFVIGNATYQAGLQFYDSLLPEVTTEKNRGRISGIGVGVGYLGSYVAVGIGFLVPSSNKPLLFGLIAATFLLFAIPCFIWVKERGNPNPRPIFGWQMVRESTAQTIRTLKEGHKYPGLLRFLFGRVFYTDAVNTVIAYMTLYAVNVAMARGDTVAAGENTARLVMMSAITFAVIGGFAWGWTVDRIGPKRTLNIVLGLWLATFALASSIGFFQLAVGWLYLVGAMAGIAMGGVWSADRPYMLRLTPPDRIGEFYGLYGMVGRFSAVTGPLLWSAIMFAVVERGGAHVLTGQALALLSLLGMVLVGWYILRPVSDAPRDWEALRSA
ncbi:MAG: MFS transporter [Gemmatimonadetes bacterium]|nr:MFS transporter [Gemmatimonadota bacterium]